MPPGDTSTFRRVLGLLAVCVLLTTACGASGTDHGDGGGAGPGPSTGPPSTTDPGGSSIEAEYREALAAGLVTDGGAVLLDPDQADCAATGLLDELGVDRLEAARIAPDDLRGPAPDGVIEERLDLSESEREAFGIAFVLVFLDCGVDLLDEYRAEMVDQPIFDPDDRGCVDEVIDADFVRRLIAAGDGAERLELPTGDPALDELFLDLLVSCASNTRAALFEAEEGPLTEDQRSCLDEELSDEFLRDFFASAATDEASPDPEIEDTLLSAYVACIGPLADE